MVCVEVNPALQVLEPGPSPRPAPSILRCRDRSPSAFHHAAPRPAGRSATTSSAKLPSGRTLDGELDGAGTDVQERPNRSRYFGESW